jgi:hypothetical protein
MWGSNKSRELAIFRTGWDGSRPRLHGDEVTTRAIFNSTRLRGRRRGFTSRARSPRRQYHSNELP